MRAKVTKLWGWFVYMLDDRYWYVIGPFDTHQNAMTAACKELDYVANRH